MILLLLLLLLILILTSIIVLHPFVKRGGVGVWGFSASGGWQFGIWVGSNSGPQRS